MPKSEEAAQLASLVSKVDRASLSSSKFDRVRDHLVTALGLAKQDVLIKAVGNSGAINNRLGELSNREDWSRKLAILVAEGSLVPGIVSGARKKITGVRPVIGAIGVYDVDAERITHLLHSGDSKLSGRARAVFGVDDVELVEVAAESTGKVDLAPARDTEELAQRLFVPKSWLDDVLWLLNDKRAIVLYGPPGTGKTYLAREIARFVQSRPELRRFVQFHPSFGYENFFEGYVPSSAGESLRLEKRSGPLRTLADAARTNSEPAVMVMDEVNRGNLARVFGELYFLLEYRDEAVSLMYSPEEAFSLPASLQFIGTMNTSDRSIVSIDQALRRRFHFVPLFPDRAPVDEMLRSYLSAHRPSMTWAADFLERVNQKLGDPHLMVGPSHFMRRDLDESALRKIWAHSIRPSIEEQFFGRSEELGGFELEALIRDSRSTSSHG